MGWIKRNLVFVISGIVAIGLLGGAGFFIYQSWSRNADARTKINEIYDTLQQLAQAPLQPGNDKIDNIKIAKDQNQQVRAWIQKAELHFAPVPPIPQGKVNSKTYATALGSAIFQLKQTAKDASVVLPPDYCFSFQAQNNKLTISSGLDALAQQLGEVKAMVDILFAARVNNLDSIQRVRVSDDDIAAGLQADYTDMQPTTNDLAIITPYFVTFRSFTPELAKVIAGFATSTNPFIVKSVSVQPASQSASPDGMQMGAPNQEYPQQYPYGAPPPAYPYGAPQGYAQYNQGRVMPPNYYRGLPGMPQAVPQQQQAVAGLPGKGGLQTVLKEQLLRITLEVDVVKLLPKS